MITKYVNRDYLEHRVNCINAELINSHHEAKERQRLEAARNYYVSKLVELDESGLNLVDIESYEQTN